MKLRPFRLTVLALMTLVALCALGLGGYRAYERRSECLVRAREHEESERAYRKSAENYKLLARLAKETEEDTGRRVVSRRLSNNKFWNDQARQWHAFAARDQAEALSSESYARFHERMKNRYLEVARHPWRRLPKDASSPDAELIADLEAIARQEPSNGQSHENLGVLWAKKGDHARALAEFALAIENDDELITAHNDSAWILATCPDAELRDGQKAISLATRACELTKWKEAGLLDTLAAAYAEAGQFDSAVAWQTKALELLAKSSDDSEAYTQRLRLYEAKQPFRQNASP